MLLQMKFMPGMIVFFSSAFLAFGLCQVHALSGVTEGGVLGLTLLLQEWFDISPAWSGLVLNLTCYLLGFRILGKQFVTYSLVSAAGFSITYKILEQFPPLWPELAEMPLLAAVVGALFVGVGAGLSVCMGGATSGDDALAMSIAAFTGVRIQTIYLISDLLVLLLSLSYIPFKKIMYSLLTVVLSGQIIGWIQSGYKRKTGKKSCI